MLRGGEIARKYSGSAIFIESIVDVSSKTLGAACAGSLRARRARRRPRAAVSKSRVQLFEALSASPRRRRVRRYYQGEAGRQNMLFQMRRGIEKPALGKS